MIETRATVVGNKPEIQNFWRLRIRTEAEITPRPGQFAMIRAHNQFEPILRRALTFYRVKSCSAATECEFIYKVVGRGTTRLASLRVGDVIDFLGPLGNGFMLDKRIETDSEVALVSGGVGIPALYLLAEELKRRGAKPRLFHGEVTGDKEHGLACVSDFTDLLGTEFVTCATEDGSVGVKGMVTVPLEEFLRSSPHRLSMIFACGPNPMLKKVAEVAAAFSTPAQVSLEANMACGFGVCLGCAVKVKDTRGGRLKYQRACREGPVFRADEVIWDEESNEIRLG